MPSAVGAIDPDELIERMDINALLERIDIDGLLGRIDMDQLLDRIDVDGLIKRVDLNELLTRIDLDALIGQLDVDALIARLDVNALIGRLDMKALVAAAGINDIVAEATTGVATRTVDLARRQLVGVDIIMLGAVDRVTRRPRQPIPRGQISATGRPAGPLTRLLAFGFDAIVVTAMFSITVAVGTALVGLFTGHSYKVTENSGPFWTISYFAWWGLYLWGCVVIAGRTVGKALFGLRILDLDAGPLGPGRAALRTIAFPFSFILGLGFIPAIVRTDRRAFHELVAGSCEVIDWGDRSADLPSALQGWLERRSSEVITIESAAAAMADPMVTGPSDGSAQPESAAAPTPSGTGGEVAGEPVAHEEQPTADADPGGQQTTVAHHPGD